MAKNKGGLGRGLDAIFADNSEEVSSGVNMVRVADIEPRADQPRKKFDQEALSALSASIVEHGMIQPIVVRASAGGFYEIIAGERRWRAAKMAGLAEVPVIISEYNDTETAEIALVENVQRENLSAVEEAIGYNALMSEYGYTQEQVSQKVGKSRSAVANTLRLLELPDRVLQMITEGALSAGHARALLALENKKQITEAANTVVSRDLSVRATEALVKKLKNKKDKPEKTKSPLEVNYIERLERRARGILGRKVAIKNSGKAKKIELSYEDDEDLESLLKALCGKDFLND